jgi:hypothetical protein
MKFVSKQLAMILKEKGFDRPCINAYNAHGCQYLNGWCEYLDERDTDFIYLSDLHDKDCLCPTINQVIEWLREDKNIHINVYALPSNVQKGFRLLFGVRVSYFKEEMFNYYDLDEPYFKYEDACIAGIEYVINNLIDYAKY